MNTRLRKHLTGSMAFYSHIPLKMREYDFVRDKSLGDQIATLRHLADELNGMIERSGSPAVSDILAVEARDSWRLSSNESANPFAVLGSFHESENAANIRRATTYAVEALTELPLCSRLFCNMHYIVCESPEYDKEYRGEYRTSPVWIGRQGCLISDAAFVPPVGEDLTEALSDLERFIHYADEDVFVKAAMIHYQFEMIHPFIDANGRMGRLLVALFLYDSKVLHSPALLLSNAVSAYREKYYRMIQDTNMTGDMDTWIRFFLSVLEYAIRLTLKEFVKCNSEG